MDESDENDQSNQPRDVGVVYFVKDRLKQIAELVQAIDNGTQATGEMKRGLQGAPRTATQRLPRHMRRRAMSYNIKRFPRSQRRFAKSAVSASKHRKKPPSRFWRRRPRNLLLNYIRRQRKYVWLETHIWHAKRFRMIEKWEYKLPLCSYQRAFRASYRDAVRHCVVRDASYLRCFQIVAMDQNALIELLRKLCAPEVGPTFAFKTALSGHYEMPLLLYEPGQYPHGFIAPVRYSWSKNKDDEKYSLAIWTHPSASDKVLSKLIELLKLRKQDQKIQMFKADKQPRNVDEWRLKNSQIKTEIYNSDEYDLQLLDLSDQLIRYRLHGPKSFSVLNEALNVVEESELKDSWMKEFLLCNQFWKNECVKRGPGELPNNIVLNLLVEDPRLTRPSKKTKPIDNNLRSTQLLDVNSLPLPVNEFWNFEIRRKILEKKITEADLQKKRSAQLQPVKTSEAKIPVIVVIRNTGKGTTNPFIGLDLIVPSGFGMEFWLALQYSTARSIGLRDQKFLEMESSRFNFPADVPDCAAGCSEFAKEYISLQEKYIRRPCNRRIEYWNKLSIKYPFTFQFTELTRNWFADSGSSANAYVLRDRRMLQVIKKWLNGKGPAPEDSAALVPVVLFPSSRGRPLRFALICAPTDDDIRAVADLPSDVKSVEIVEKPRVLSSKSNAVEENEEEMEEIEKSKVKSSDLFPHETYYTHHQHQIIKMARSRMIQDYISLDVSHYEKVVSLDMLFPDKELLRKRRIKEAKKRKKTMRKLKRLKTSLEKEEENAGKVKATMVEYRNSCSRTIIGRVMRGGYSLLHGKGFAVGYCCLPALKTIQNCKVLYRNVTSKYYHPARIAVLTNQLDL